MFENGWLSLGLRTRAASPSHSAVPNLRCQAAQLSQRNPRTPLLAVIVENGAAQCRSPAAAVRPILRRQLNYPARHTRLLIWHPSLAELAEKGAEVTIVGSEAGKTYEGKNGRVQVTADKAGDEVSADQFDAIVVPGGKAPARMRKNQAMVKLVQRAAAAGKPIAAICHGTQLLATAGVLEGRTVTSWPGVQDEIRSFGADWRDEEVIVYGNLINSHQAGGIPAFNAAVVRALSG